MLSKNVLLNWKIIDKDFDDFWHRKLTLRVKFWHILNLPITPILKIQSFPLGMLIFRLKSFQFCTPNSTTRITIMAKVQKLIKGSLSKIGNQFLLKNVSTRDAKNQLKMKNQILKLVKNHQTLVKNQSIWWKIQIVPRTLGLKNQPMMKNLSTLENQAPRTIKRPHQVQKKSQTLNDQPRLKNQALCAVHVIFEMFYFIGVECRNCCWTWDVIYFLLFGWGKFN